MKKAFNTELPITLSNLAWRVLAPFFILVLLGYSLAKTLHFNLFFTVSFALFSICVTIWGITVTVKETIRSQNE